MGLRNLVINTDTVPYGTDQEITLRGVSPSDLTFLMNDYGPQMAILYSRLQSGDEFANAEVSEVLGTLASEVPDLVASVIAAATGDIDPETVKVARTLDLMTQVECLQKIFALTFKNEAELKKLEAFLTNLVMRAATALGPKGSTAGSGASEEM